MPHRSIEYVQGSEAFCKDVPNRTCPYQRGSGDKRIDWFKGWYGARVRKLLDKVKKNLGLKDAKNS